MATNKAPVEHGGSGDFVLVLFAKTFAVLFVDRAARFHDVDAGKGGDKGRQCKLNRVLHWYMFQGLKIVRFELQKISFLSYNVFSITKKIYTAYNKIFP